MDALLNYNILKVYDKYIDFLAFKTKILIDNTYRKIQEHYVISSYNEEQIKTLKKGQHRS